MTILVHRYELIPRARMNARAGTGTRRGALLNIDGGYADVHPWPELGDADLDEQLALLARGETTALTAQSLRFAAADAAARCAGRSLFDGLTVPRSHWPAAAGEALAGFDIIKIKMPGSELPPAGRLRLDFNATLDAGAFARLARTLPRERIDFDGERIDFDRERIDFVEDPCPYDPATWRALREETGLRLALDRQIAFDGVDVLVIKPAIQNVEGAGLGVCEVVVTSYMDHPIGQLHAAVVAARIAPNAICGLVTHLLYEPNAFSERLALDGARLVPPGGIGIGFDDLLEGLPWTTLATMQTARLPATRPA
jgi:O-succinylbenzoate synthase